ncbi:MAG: DNA methyltransferase [Armatimonadota bacterium]
MREERVGEQVSLLYVPVPAERVEARPEEDWDYATADTKTHTHGFHPYPAMMIPQVARRLIRMYGRTGYTLLDPFCGSGTSLVEARLSGINAYGIDLNPLAVLLARVKSTPLPDALAIFLAKAEANIAGMAQFVSEVKGEHWVQVMQGDMRVRQPIPSETIDLVVTSPPYGDSHTTVAYGQFSRLSLQWLGLPDEEAKSVDSRALGGKQVDIETLPYPSQTLEATYEQIAQSERRRARQVRAFYDDFALCLAEITRVCRKGAIACFVVGNRTVRGVKIPTDTILVEMAEGFGWRFVEAFERRIPNKRMPLRNSPSNVPGEQGETMLGETIVVLEATC